MVAEFSSTRLKRENCKRTKHDSNFSKWEILVAPSDWEDYSLGKEGAERYRIHNLPKVSGPGLYELGIAVSSSGLGREIAKLDADWIVVVYIGEADNVRTRLQHYGRSGSHLGNGYLCFVDCKVIPLEKGPGLFQEMFTRGYSILYRWAPMKNKRDAQMTEAQLLKTFDYAWNTSGNGARRHNDVLKKLEDIASQTKKFTIITRKLLPFRQKQMGIKIKTSKPIPTENKTGEYGEERSSFFSRILHFSRSRPRLVVNTDDVSGADSSSCGVVIGYGVVCRKPPVEGRKRCAEHKGMKVNGLLKNSYAGATIYGDTDFSGSNAETSYNTEELSVQDSFPNKGNFLPICGIVLYDGSPCRRTPVQGRKRCEEHKGQRIRRSTLTSCQEAKPKVLLDVITSQYKQQTSPTSKQESILIAQDNSPDLNSSLERKCGVDLGNGLYCTRQPVKGRVRCGEHKGMRINGLISRLATVSDTISVRKH
ncbi:protein EFFECTOR OF TRANSCRIPTION 2-like isoform X1 [Cucurbita maxima]|uniref:Protein EFFECTOR OF TRANSCRIPTION 2-like isoform X1 n=1 Tax=Cucurbita maxima TaxID=3661 RepID=A0A6J1JJM4_CUCMA|nr:protein EFFECTOR OF TRANSCRIPTION 2-like isoform X1 [Cucurbita maxima]